MALNHGPGAKGAVSSPPCKINEYLSHRFAKGLSSLLALMRRSTAHRLAIAFGSRSLVGFGNPHAMSRVYQCKEGAKIKIIIFSIKFAKFTRYFDKFLKIVSLANDCNQNRLPYKSECGALRFSAPKSFPAPPHFPATACICARGRVGT